MEQTPWHSYVSLTIGANIRHHRNRLGISAQHLADRITALGYPMARTTIANLENRIKGHVSVADLMAFAHGLHVPPALLVFPVGRDADCFPDPTGYADNKATPTWDAYQWFISATPSYDGTVSLDAWIDAAPGLNAYNEEDRLLARYSEIRHSLRYLADQAAGETNPDVSAAYQPLLALKTGDLDSAARAITQHRKSMHDNEITLRPLPEGITI
jgi:transcriptional regulator with XRE-family HTH domain